MIGDMVVENSHLESQQNIKMLVCVKTFEIGSDIFVESCFYAVY